MSAFTEIFKITPDTAKSFAFFETKNEEFYNLLSKHSMKALGVMATIVHEVRSLTICFHARVAKNQPLNTRTNLNIIYFVAL